MKKKKNLYIAMLIAGLCLVGITFVLRNQWTGRTIGTVMGCASALTSISVVQLLVLWQEAENPRIRRQNEIDRNDERNRAVRNRAGALSGTILQGIVLAAGWVAYGLNAPVWILLLATAVFIAKGVLDLCLTAYFQSRM